MLENRLDYKSMEICWLLIFTIYILGLKVSREQIALLLSFILVECNTITTTTNSQYQQ